MSEILLQTIIEKLESLEQSLKQNNDNKDELKQEQLFEQLKNSQSEIKTLSTNILSNEVKMSALITSLNKCTSALQQPVKNIIEHKHHFHKGILISIALLVISILLSFGWFKSYNTEKLYEANDIKYRSLKLITTNPYLTYFLYQCFVQPKRDSFRINVIKQENKILH